VLREPEERGQHRHHHDAAADAEQPAGEPGAETRQRRDEPARALARHSRRA
jgi:hypothetical protein